MWPNLASLIFPADPATCSRSSHKLIDSAGDLLAVPVWQ